MIWYYLMSGAIGFLIASLLWVAVSYRIVYLWKTEIDRLTKQSKSIDQQLWKLMSDLAEDENGRS